MWMDARLWILTWFQIKPYPWLHENLFGLRFVFVEFKMNVLCVLYDLSVWSVFFFVKMFMFCINFQLWFCFGLVLSQTLIFGFIHDWTSVFGSTRLVLLWVKHLKLCLYEQIFVKGFFFFFLPKRVFSRHTLKSIWQFSREKKYSFVKHDLTKIHINKKNQKMIFSCCIRPNPYKNCILFIKRREKCF
jgi:hypothetical protein